MTLKRYATGWYLCSGCNDAVEPEKAEVYEERGEVYCEKCILQGHNTV